MQVPQETLESHDADEMEMSDDEASICHRYGKRARSDSKVLAHSNIKKLI